MQNGLNVFFLLTRQLKVGQLQGCFPLGLRDILQGPASFHSASPRQPKTASAFREGKKG